MKTLRLLFSKEIIFSLFALSAFIKSSMVFLPQYIDLLFLLLTIPIIFYSLWKEDFRVEKVVFILFLALLTLIIYMSMNHLLLSRGFEYGEEKLLRFTGITAMTMFAAIIILKTQNSLKRFFLAIVALAFLTCVFSFFNNTIEAEGVGLFRMSGYLPVGQIAGMGIIVLFGFFLSRDLTKKQMIIAWACAAVITATLLISGSKMATGSAMVGILLILWRSIAFNKNGIKISKQIKIVTVMSFALMIVCIPLYLNGYFDYAIYRFSGVMDSDFTGGNRDLLALTGIEVFKENWLFGAGLGSFGVYFFNNKDIAAYPHNIFIELLSEIGLVGFVLFLLIFVGWVVAWFGNRKLVKQDPYFSTLTVLSLFWLLNAAITGDINSNKLFFVFMALVIVYPVFLRKKERQVSLNQNAAEV